jgi:DeoR/GlpR family transcriptional regulator of sugar metabolism
VENERKVSSVNRPPVSKGSRSSQGETTTQSLLGAERRERITELVRANGVVRVEELARRFGVSSVTIRNDLAALAERGVLLRDRGGAIAQAHTTFGLAFDERAKIHREGKRRIGEAAAQFIEAGDTVILDAGTTVMELARCFPPVSPLTVVTNAWNVAAQVGALPGVHVLLAGGSLSRETMSTAGPWTEHELNDLVVDKVFLGASSLDPDRGIVGRTVEVSRVKAAMIRAARQVILLADASKWGRNAFVRVAEWSSVHILITDADVPPEAANAVRKARVRVIHA